MSDEAHPPVPIPAAEREIAVQRLSVHFAHDHIGLAELERRLDLVYAATDRSSLVALTSDLPALPVESEAAETLPRAVVDPGAEARDRDFMVAIMGGTERKGPWTPPRHLTVLTLMGGAELDFRDCRFGTAVTNVVIVAVMGGAEIIVPPGVRVECSGIAIMGGFEGAGGAAGGAGAPVIRLSGFVLMGGVEVKVRLPGESDREAKKRLKGERAERKRLRGS